MKKLLIAFFSLFVMANANAAIITTDLTSDTYITNNGLDWTWASPVAAENWGGGNVLKAPSFHAGWRYATLLELDYLDSILDLFFDANGGQIQSAQYWNTTFTHVDSGDWNAGSIASGPGTPGYNSYFESVYVRDVNVNAVPVPAALFLFAPALLGFLGLRRKITTA